MDKVITIGSNESGEKKYKVEIGNGGLHSVKFCVYAFNEQDALDAAVDYCEKQGWNGLFWDDDESVNEYPDDFYTAGNSSHLLRSDCFYVSQMNESKKKTLRLTESQLRKMISESVKKVLSENWFDDQFPSAHGAGRVYGNAWYGKGEKPLKNPTNILPLSRVRTRIDAAQRINGLIQKFVYQAEEAHKDWTLDSMAQYILDNYNINDWFDLEDIKKRLKKYIGSVYNNLIYYVD